MAANRGLVIGSGIAQGLANFTQAYQQGQQRQVQNAQAEQELAYKKQLYELQMKKLQREVEPVKIDALRFSTLKAAAEGGFVPEGSDQKFALEAMKDYTPTQLQAAKRYMSGMDQMRARGDDLSGGIPVNKEEIGLLKNTMSLESANFFKQGMLGQRNEERESKYAAIEKDQGLKANELEQKKLKIESDLKFNEKKLEFEGAMKQKEIEMKALQAQLDEYVKRETVGNNKKRTEIDERRESNQDRHNRRMEEIAERNASTAAKKASRVGGNHDSPEIKSIVATIQEKNKAFNKALTDPVRGFMDSEDNRQARIKAIKDELFTAYDAYKKMSGKPYGLDPRSEAPAAPSGKGYFGDGRVGPIAPGAPAQPSGSVRVMSPKGVSGTWNLSKGPVPQGYKVIK